ACTADSLPGAGLADVRTPSNTGASRHASQPRDPDRRARGRSTCLGQVGRGRLSEVDTIIGWIRHVLGKDGDLAGKKVVVTAGGTHEAIDRVRFVGNSSSGKMGFALAEAARDRGANVVLVSGPSALPDPVAVEIVRVRRAAEMRDAVIAGCADADIL